MHPVTLPETPSAVRLIGARIAPYPGAPAAFLVYRSQDRPLGLLIRSLTRLNRQRLAFSLRTAATRRYGRRVTKDMPWPATLTQSFAKDRNGLL